jgi:hypothetical protein
MLQGHPPLHIRIPSDPLVLKVFPVVPSMFPGYAIVPFTHVHVVFVLPKMHLPALAMGLEQLPAASAFA